jgi:hypothetical protein
VVEDVVAHLGEAVEVAIQSSCAKITFKDNILAIVTQHDVPADASVLRLCLNYLLVSLTDDSGYVLNACTFPADEGVILCPKNL